MTPTEIRAWRTAAGLSQPSLAQFLGVDVMTVSRWERGITEPQPYLKLALGKLIQLGWDAEQRETYRVMAILHAENRQLRELLARFCEQVPRGCMHVPTYLVEASKDAIRTNLSPTA